MTPPRLRPPSRRATTRPYHARWAWIAVCFGVWTRPAPAGELAATRVVSLAPAATEIVIALGHGRRLVAVDAVSARLPSLRDLPVTDPASAHAFSPDLLLVPAADAPAARRAAPGSALIEVAPHDFDEAWELYRSIGAACGQAEEARRYVREISRPLAEIGASSFGRRRPRVVAVLALDPFEIAGGHSFVTDVIELAGGENVSHGTEEPRLAWSPEAVARAAPELALLVLSREPTPAETSLARRLLGPAVRIEPLAIDPDRFWLDGAVPAVERVRGWIEPLSTGASEDRVPRDGRPGGPRGLAGER